MDVNFFGAVNMTSAALSVTARTSRPDRRAVERRRLRAAGVASGYAASKHALHGFFDSLRAELHGTPESASPSCAPRSCAPASANTHWAETAAARRCTAHRDGQAGGPGRCCRRRSSTPPSGDGACSSTRRGRRSRTPLRACRRSATSGSWFVGSSATYAELDQVRRRRDPVASARRRAVRCDGPHYPPLGRRGRIARVPHVGRATSFQVGRGSDVALLD